MVSALRADSSRFGATVLYGMEAALVKCSIVFFFFHLVTSLEFLAHRRSLPFLFFLVKSRVALR